MLNNKKQGFYYSQKIIKLVKKALENGIKLETLNIENGIQINFIDENSHTSAVSLTNFHKGSEDKCVK
jgi:hypothetical protein